MKLTTAYRLVQVIDRHEAEINEARGSTPFEQWIEEAIAERLHVERLVRGPAVGGDGLDKLYVAVVETEGGEAILLWRVNHPTLGITMLPVVTGSIEQVYDWNELIGFELNAMDGEPIHWREFERGDFVAWLRQERPEESECQ